MDNNNTSTKDTNNTKEEKTNLNNTTLNKAQDKKIVFKNF